MKWLSKHILFSILLLITGHAFAIDKTTVNIGMRFIFNDFDKELNPINAATIYQDRILSDMFEALLMKDKDASPMPGIAQSWEISPDGMTYVFQLREDAKWSDGNPVVAEDFVLAINNLVKLGRVTYSAKALGPKKLELTLSEPILGLLEKLSYYRYTAVPSHLYKKVGEDWAKPANFISNGPYTFDLKNSEPSKKVSLIKNPHYWDTSIGN